MNQSHPKINHVIVSVLFHKRQVIFVNVLRCEPKKSFERKLCWALFQFRRILVLFHCLIIQLITLRTLKFKDITMSVNYIFFYQFLRRENFSQIILVGFIYKWNYFPLANFSKSFRHSVVTQIYSEKKLVVNNSKNSQENISERI